MSASFASTHEFFLLLGVFSFTSLRKEPFPFALTLFINGLATSRVSVCCENRHRKGVRIGGKISPFAMCGVRRLKSVERFDLCIEVKTRLHLLFSFQEEEA